MPPAPLPHVEFDLLAALARRPGTAVSRAWLADHVLDPDREGGERTLDVHASRLRRKLGPAGASIVTVWGIGYRLEPEAPS
jgi:two-component system response regulator MtrA